VSSPVPAWSLTVRLSVPAPPLTVTSEPMRSNIWAVVAMMTASVPSPRLTVSGVVPPPVVAWTDTVTSPLPVLRLRAAKPP